MTMRASDLAFLPFMLGYLASEHFPTAVDKLPPALKRRIIWGRDGKTPYLARFYLTKPPYMADGSEAFDAHGNQRPGSITGEESWIPRVFVHYFYRSDDAGMLHNHPWSWAISLILSGGYSEERRTSDDRVTRKNFWPWSLNLLTKQSFHRVDLLEPGKGAWSVFVVAHRTGSWGFWDRVAKTYTDWKDYLPNEHAPNNWAKP